MRITKAIAEVTAEKMMAKKVAAQEKEKKAFNNKIKKLYLENIPKSIKTASKKYPDFFSFHHSISLGPRFSWGSVYLKDNVVQIKGGKDVIPRLDDKVLDPYVKEYDELKSNERKLFKTQEDLVNALYGLRTMKNVEASLPEALPFLPKSTSTGVAVIDFSKLREEIS